jgi:hypothetical protein
MIVAFYNNIALELRFYGKCEVHRIDHDPRKWLATATSSPPLEIF